MRKLAIISLADLTEEAIAALVDKGVAGILLILPADKEKLGNLKYQKASRALGRDSQQIGRS